MYFASILVDVVEVVTPDVLDPGAAFRLDLLAEALGPQPAQLGQSASQNLDVCRWRRQLPRAISSQNGPDLIVFVDLLHTHFTCR